MHVCLNPECLLTLFIFSCFLFSHVFLVSFVVCVVCFLGAFVMALMRVWSLMKWRVSELSYETFFCARSKLAMDLVIYCYCHWHYLWRLNLMWFNFFVFFQTFFGLFLLFFFQSSSGHGLTFKYYSPALPPKVRERVHCQRPRGWEGDIAIFSVLVYWGKIVGFAALLWIIWLNLVWLLDLPMGGSGFISNE